MWQNTIFLVIMVFSFLFVAFFYTSKNAVFGITIYLCLVCCVVRLTKVFPKIFPFLVYSLMVFKVLMGKTNFETAPVFGLLGFFLSFLSTFESSKSLIKEIKQTEAEAAYHREKEFFLWSFIEKVTILSLLSRISFEGVFLESNSLLLDSYQTYMYLFLVISMGINMLIMFGFNPPGP